MSWIIDGSNVLGRMGGERESDDSKRALVQQFASFARAQRTKVVVVFDGAPPAGFAVSLGTVSVEFAHPLSADERIVKRCASGGQCTVVTSDLGLAARVRSRRVRVVSVEEIRPKLMESERSGGGEETDWQNYFSDPKNRNV